MPKTILIGAPIDSGQKRPGCLMGPAAYRVAGLAREIVAEGHGVDDWGDLSLPALHAVTCANPAVHSLAGTFRLVCDSGKQCVIEWDFTGVWQAPTDVALISPTYPTALPIRYASATTTYNSVALCVQNFTFDAFPPFPAPVPAYRICMFGIRSVDPAEQAAMLVADIQVNDMRVIDERGLVAPLREFLDLVRREGGMLHVSLDVDFLDPAIAPAVGTTVPGGTTFREAHLVMEVLHESGLVTSLDLVELNPFLDDRGMTARLMVDLVGSLMGKKVFDRPTRSK
ncbi:MAG: arginase [Rhodobacterales bacterium 32-66-7]|nr:MAG: arginase [Rhodobacterales bacterium 32-66-7]